MGPYRTHRTNLCNHIKLLVVGPLGPANAYATTSPLGLRGRIGQLLGHRFYFSYNTLFYTFLLILKNDIHLILPMVWEFQNYEIHLSSKNCLARKTYKIAVVHKLFVYMQFDPLVPCLMICNSSLRTCFVKLRSLKHTL